MAGTILVGCDASDCANAALDVALGLARELGDQVVIAYAYEPPVRSAGEEVGVHRRALAEIGREVTGPALERARAAGVDAEVELVAERPVPALLDLARVRGARLIVVGTYGESPLRGAIVGSVPHKLLQVSETPVLVVPHAAAREAVAHGS
jgi:nucleotide-binding universal stress UspA family protein